MSMPSRRSPEPPLALPKNPLRKTGQAGVALGALTYSTAKPALPGKASRGYRQVARNGQGPLQPQQRNAHSGQPLLNSRFGELAQTVAQPQPAGAAQQAQRYQRRSAALQKHRAADHPGRGRQTLSLAIRRQARGWHKQPAGRPRRARAELRLHCPHQRVGRTARFGVSQQAPGDRGLAAQMQQPGIQKRSAYNVQMRAGRVRAERQRPPVVARLHVAPHHADLGVGGMQDQGGAFEGIERRRRVQPGQRRFAGFKQAGALLQTGGCQRLRFMGSLAARLSRQRLLQCLRASGRP